MFPRLLSACLCAALLLAGRAGAAELPTLHLRRAASPPPMSMSPAMLQNPAQAAAWYPSSPTWFGGGGLDGARNHVEVLATYDDAALYLAFLVIDKSPSYALSPADLLQCDRNAIWIQTPQGRRFCFIPQLNGYYPAAGLADSLEITHFTGYSPLTNALPLWGDVGWTGAQTWQNMVTIPWAAMSTRAPTSGSRWRVNLVNYNQTSPARTAATVNVERWAPGTETQPDGWGTLAFDEAGFTPPAAVSPEATLTLRPATGFGQESNVSPGDNAATRDVDGGAGGVTQSDWNDWDPISYDRKELLQFDLSLIPRDRVILGATLENYFYAPFEITPSDLYVHVQRLATPYDPAAVTMLTAPPPVENGDRVLVPAARTGWVSLDVSAAVAAAFASGAPKVALALTGSSGDIANGKAWVRSQGRADWYDMERPRLHITFGKPGVTYAAPVSVGSLNSTSVAGAADKNKLTNGTFRHGALEGVSNTTYWQDPGSAYLGGRNVPLLQLAGDVNTVTGDPAARLITPVGWASVQQTATGLAGGQTYTLRARLRTSAKGQVASIGVSYLDAAGNVLGTGYQPYVGDGAWGAVSLTLAAPAGTARATVGLAEWNSADANGYILMSDFQLEAGASPTAYAETMGFYYPDFPRSAEGGPPARAMYRLFALRTHDHLYTTSADEARAAAAGGFYRGEGVIGYAPAAGGAPVFRLYRPATGEHFYTRSLAERDRDVRGGWHDEGAAFAVLAGPAPGALPLYRLYSPAWGRHFYTTGQAERDALVRGGSWNDEGSLGYLSATP